jgi:hypothetical protein
VRLNAGATCSLTDEMRDKGIRLLTSVRASTFYMGFNMLDPVVGGSRARRARKLRQALSIAIDQEEFISIFMNGRGIAAMGPLPPGIFGYREGEAGINPVVYDWVDGRPRRKSVEEAKKLLAEAGWPNGRNAKTGEPLVLNLDTTSGGMGEKSTLDWLTRQFAKLDIQLVVRSTDFNRFQEKIRKGAVQLYYLGWNADYPDPENFLFLLAALKARSLIGGENASNYANAEYDRLFERMKNMESDGPRGAERLAIIREESPRCSTTRRGFSAFIRRAIRSAIPGCTTASRWMSATTHSQISAHRCRRARALAGRNGTSRCSGRCSACLRRWAWLCWLPYLPIVAVSGVRRTLRVDTMLAYLLRRLLYAIPILIGVNLITFALFFVVNTPDDMARMQLGVKRVTPEAIEKWKAERGYDKPLFINGEARGGSALLPKPSSSAKSARMFVGDFGRAEDGRDIAREITSRMGPSLAIALPTFILGLFVTVSLACCWRFFAPRRSISGASCCAWR